MIQIEEQQHAQNMVALEVADVLAMQARLMLDETRDAQKREFEGIVMKLCRKYAALRAGLKPVERVF